jgi:hypothetical protein
MKNSYIKKIISVTELENVSKDLQEILQNELNLFNHTLDLKHDGKLMTKSFSHESLLIWNFHIWAHFNGEKWDALFAGIIRKSEKFNKKFMDEYLWISNNPKVGVSLYKCALAFAKEQKCEFISMNVVENIQKSNKLKKFLLKNGFSKDTETYLKRIS